MKAKPSSWKNVPKNVIGEIIKDCDGHTINKPEWLLDLGIPADLVKRHTEIMESSGVDPKGMIFKDGQVVRALEGVYTLTLLYAIARALDLTKALDEAHGYMGRGRQACALIDGIHKYVNEESNAA